MSVGGKRGCSGKSLLTDFRLGVRSSGRSTSSGREFGVEFMEVEVERLIAGILD